MTRRTTSARSRVGLSLVAVFAGWLAATLATLPFEAIELSRNAAAGQAAMDVARGWALWFGFTLLLAVGAWLVPVLAVTLLVPAGVIIRYRFAIAFAASALVLALMFHQLGTFSTLYIPEADNPLFSHLMQMYTTFTVVFAFGTTFTYSRLLQRSRASGLDSSLR